MGEDIRALVEQEAKAIVNQKEGGEQIATLIDSQIEQTNDIKKAVDFFATRTALAQEETWDKVVGEKQEELRNDAEAKKVHAETERVKQEELKVIAEREKQIAEYDKVISAKQKEVEQLKAESDKAQAYFDSNKDILRYIGIREKKSIRAMQGLMFPATIIFVIVQVLLFPLTFCGLLLETIVNILGSVCGAIKNNAWKIVLSVLVVLLLIGVGVGVYFLVVNYLIN